MNVHENASSSRISINLITFMLLWQAALAHASKCRFPAAFLHSCSTKSRIVQHSFKSRFVVAPSFRFYASSSNDDLNDGSYYSPFPENLYQQWSLQDDQTLWENHRDKSIAELASMLGRNVRGIQYRLEKLKDVKSTAYQRLFADDAYVEQQQAPQKLIPASEVIRRIKWDFSLPEQEFSIIHYDRVEDKYVQSPFTAPNDSIAGKQTTLVDALPEHRIMAIKYRDRVIWDRQKRKEIMFSYPGIDHVMRTYDGWYQQQQEAVELNRLRQRQIAEKLQQILGNEKYQQLKFLSNKLQEASLDPTISLKIQVERYVQQALDLFKSVRDDHNGSINVVLIPMSDYEALDVLSEMVALLPQQQEQLQSVILDEIVRCMQRVTGKQRDSRASSKQKQLPTFSEDEITETFVRGSGPGGQKINKTSNRVVLVHDATGVRVECQDTRSLEQNRKIARKRLRIKLDEYYNGSQSKASLQAQEAANKKQKSKARSKARQRRKQEIKASSARDTTAANEDDEEF